MKTLLLISLLLLSSCSTYKWVDPDKCDDELGTYKHCKVVK